MGEDEPDENSEACNNGDGCWCNCCWCKRKAFRWFGEYARAVILFTSSGDPTIELAINIIIYMSANK